MRTQIVAAVAALSLSALSIASAQTSQVLEKLAGVWTADPLEVRLNSDFDVSVWGPNASSIRKVELTLKPSGEGSITVTRSVVDAKGQTKPASVSIEEARLMLKAPETVDPNRIEPTVQGTRPERRYPDDPKDRTAIEARSIRSWRRTSSMIGSTCDSISPIAAGRSAKRSFAAAPSARSPDRVSASPPDHRDTGVIRCPPAVRDKRHATTSAASGPPSGDEVGARHPTARLAPREKAIAQWPPARRSHRRHQLCPASPARSSMPKSHGQPAASFSGNSP